jgi:hypothetical protein
VRFRGTRPKKRVANLGDFPKKGKFGDSLGIDVPVVKIELFCEILQKIHFFSLGWQPGFYRSVSYP